MRIPKPWYRVDKCCWYARINGRRVSLGVSDRKAKGVAYARWRQLLATPKPNPVKRTVLTLKEAADAFLGESATRLKSSTLVWYRHAIGRLAEAHSTLALSDADHHAISKWLSAQSWSDTAKAHALGVLSVFFRWAVREELAAVNPISRIRKPRAKSRGEESVISPEDHGRLLAQASPTLKPLLVLLRETGARPSELARLNAKDVDFANGIARLHDHKTQGKTHKPRLIVLSPLALQTLRALAEQRPAGILLRNRPGLAWGKDCICRAFRRLAKRAGVKATAYGYRHTFATDALANGVPDAQVAALLGHSSTAMLYRHYSHLTAHTQAMRAALAKVRGG